MTETISIDVPVYFPCQDKDKWEQVKELVSSIDIVRDGEEAAVQYFYEPSKPYDGLGEYAQSERFPVNATMVNVSTRSQNPLINPLFISALPWQTIEFGGQVRCKFQPAESINGQVRVLVCESPQSLAPGNIESLMSGTQLSHSFSCTDNKPYIFRLFDGVKRYDNALNGMVTPGTVSFNELIRNKDLRRQYNNRCDMFSIHLLFDSVMPAGGAQAENYFVEGAKIGILTFTFDVRFVVRRGSPYSIFLQDALFRVVQGMDIGSADGGSVIVKKRSNPIPITMQNMGQNGFYGMLQPQAVRGKERRGKTGMLQVGRNVSVRDPYLRMLLFNPESELTQAVLKQYNKVYAGGRKASYPETVSSLGGGDMLFSSTYSTGFAGVTSEGVLGEEGEQAQSESLVSVYPHPGEALGFIQEFIDKYGVGNKVDMSGLITQTGSIPFTIDYTVVKVQNGKASTTEGRYAIDGVFLKAGEGALARVNASAAVDNDNIKAAGENAVPLVMGASLIVPGTWARQTVEGDEVTEEPYFQYAATGFAGQLDMDSLDEVVETDCMSATVDFGELGTNYTFVFGGEDAGFRIYKSAIPAPGVEVNNANDEGWLNLAGACMSLGAQVIDYVFKGKSGRKAGNEAKVCPLTRTDFMNDWKKSTVGHLSSLAGLVTGFMMGPRPAGMQYGIGEQQYDEKGRLMTCNFSANFSNFVPAYVSAVMPKDIVNEIKDDDENLPERVSWWQSLPGRYINANRDVICYVEENSELVPVTFNEYFGEVKFVNAITPLISRYPITDKHFAACCVIACPIGENTVISIPQKYFVSTGNNALDVKAGRYAKTTIVPETEDMDDKTQIDMCAQCNFISTTTGSVSFSFSLPEKLPEWSDNQAVMTDLKVDDHFYVYFQVGSQLVFSGNSQRHLDGDTTIFCVLGDGLTGEQPDIYVREMGPDDHVPVAVTVASDGDDGHKYACCPFLSLSGVKTAASLVSAENSSPEIVAPDGEEQQEEV